jgi:hypothetical protein
MRWCDHMGLCVWDNILLYCKMSGWYVKFMECSVQNLAAETKEPEGKMADLGEEGWQWCPVIECVGEKEGRRVLEMPQGTESL